MRPCRWQSTKLGMRIDCKYSVGGKKKRQYLKQSVTKTHTKAKEFPNNNKKNRQDSCPVQGNLIKNPREQRRSFRNTGTKKTKKKVFLNKKRTGEYYVFQC